jgi:hypothetical protein
MKRTTLIGGSLLGVGIIWLATKVNRFKRMQKNIEVFPTVKLYKLDWNELVLKVDVLVKNPSNNTVQFRYPFIKIKHKDSLIGTSIANGTLLYLPAFGQLNITGMVVQIPLSNLFGALSEILAVIKSNKPVMLTIQTLSSLKTALVEIPINETATITLKK